MVASVTTAEPEWDPEQVALLLESRAIDAERGPHGFPMSEATDPANQFVFEGSKAPLTDWAEKAKRDQMDAFYKAWPDAPRNGHIWTVKKRQPE
jgi:hypothetical protein